MSLSQLLKPDADSTYRFAQQLHALHAHAQRTPLLRLVVIDEAGSGPLAGAFQGDDLLRPSTSLALHSDLWHEKHLERLGLTPLSYDPMNVEAYLLAGKVYELQAETLPPLLAALHELAAALDRATAAQTRPASRRPSQLLFGRLTREGTQRQQDVELKSAALLTAARDVQVRPLKDRVYEWDEVMDSADQASRGSADDDRQ